MYVVIFGTFVLEGEYVMATKEDGPNMVASGQRTGTLFVIENLCMELIHYDPYWAPQRDLIKVKIYAKHRLK